MSKLGNYAIPPEGFEYVRDRIADILADEIGGQYSYTSDPELQFVSVSLEGDVPSDKQEVIKTVISISLGKTEYGSAHQGCHSAKYTFFLDVHTGAKSTASQAGDAKAAIRAQRFAGLVRAILENPAYNTLGFVKPFISRVSMREFDIAAQVQADSRYSSMIRLYFEVELPEISLAVAPDLIEGYQTVVQVGTTGLGYIYIGESYP